MTTLSLKDLEVYAYADLAAGKDAQTRSKSRRARQAIVVGARDWLERWYFPYIWAGRLSTSDFKEKILQTQEDFSPRRFGLEANGMQVLFGALVREEAKLRFGNIKMISIYQPTNVIKDYRISTGLEPVILQGRFFLQPSEIEARSELQGHPTAATKDIIDAIETLINRVAPRMPKKHVEDHERDEYAKYLRASGMSAHRIQDELDRFVANNGSVYSH